MSSPLNLLLVCYHDPDSNLIGAVRVRKFAEHLTASGCSVKVLSRAGVTSYAHGLQSTEAVAPRTQVEAPQVVSVGSARSTIILSTVTKVTIEPPAQ